MAKKQERPTAASLTRALRPGEACSSLPGHVDLVSPNTHDIHVVENSLSDQTAISIHVYGGNIGRIHRSVFDPETGTEKSFVSGYANTVVPNLWNSASFTKSLTFGGDDLK